MRFKKSTASAIIILVGLITIIGLSGLNFLVTPKTQTNMDDSRNDSILNQPKPGSMNKISLTTKDGIKIAADLYEVENPLGWLVLTHMMPATKESYKDLAVRLQRLGYESMAIDLRGHGESDAGPNGYLNFSDVQHQKGILDLEAAFDYLMGNRKATNDKVFFIGASIGANLSLQYISQHPECKTAILLSAGLNYHGIETEPLVKSLKAGQKVFFISAKDDDDNAEENQKLFDLMPVGAENKIKIYDSGGHGTNILKNQPEANNLIVEFIK